MGEVVPKVRGSEKAVRTLGWESGAGSSVRRSKDMST